MSLLLDAFDEAEFPADTPAEVIDDIRKQIVNAGDEVNPLRTLCSLMPKEEGSNAEVEKLDSMYDWHATVLRKAAYCVIRKTKEKKELWETCVGNEGQMQIYKDLYRLLGVPPERQTDSAWFRSRAAKKEAAGGINLSLNTLQDVIRAKFDDNWRNYVVSYVSSDDSRLHQTEIVRNIRERKNALDYLEKTKGIPGDKWRVRDWMVNESKKPISDGGIHFNMVGFVFAVEADERWSGWKHFVKWIDGADIKDKTTTWRKKLDCCESREDFLQLFAKEGIPKDKWRNSDWLSRQAKKPKPLGINRNLNGLNAQLAFRFGTSVAFVEYMDGLPPEGITHQDQADALVVSEAGRLGVSVNQLLSRSPNAGLAYKRVAPVLTRVLEYYSSAGTNKEVGDVLSRNNCEEILQDAFLKAQKLHVSDRDHAENLAKYVGKIAVLVESAFSDSFAIRTPSELENWYQLLLTAIHKVPMHGLPLRIVDKTLRELQNAKHHLSEKVWSFKPLQNGDRKLTDRGLAALNVARSRQGLEKIYINNKHFLKEELTEDEERGIEAIASELGEAARAEYICVKFQDRFQYNYESIRNLREWLGRVEGNGGDPLVDVPVGLFEITELSQLKQAFFNRMRDKYGALYRQGFDVVSQELEVAKNKVSHPMHAQFIQDLIEYFEDTETIPRGSRLKEELREGEEFPAKHQKVVTKEVEEHRSMLLADEMGGGKTGSTISTFEYLRERGKARKALIMCPAQIVPVWKKALSDGEGGCFKKKPKVACIERDSKEWEQAEDADYVVVSVEMARGSTGGVSHEDRIKNLGADFFALDEAHNVKNPEGADTERIYRISQTEGITQGHLMLLSGTPIPNTVQDIAAQIRLLYAGRQEVDGVDVTNIKQLTKAITRGHPLIVRNLLVRRMLRRRTQECLPVQNEFHREVQTATLNSVERAQYDAILNCPFHDAAEKIRLLRKQCLLSETKYEQVCEAVERALGREKYKKNGKVPKIVVAESWFAKGVTRDSADRRNTDDSDEDAYIAGRLYEKYSSSLKVFVLDGNNSAQKEQILSDFEACTEPAMLVTLTKVAGEGLDISCASDGILLTPTETVAKEEQFARRMNRLGQEDDVHLQVLQTQRTIEQGIAEYAMRKARVVEEFLCGRPLTEEEMSILNDDTISINRGGFFAYEVMTPREKVMWIFARIYGKGKEAVREFFAMDDGKYARDLAEYYPEQESTSYWGNTSRLNSTIIRKHLPQGDIQIADIACGCRSLERMFNNDSRMHVQSTDINSVMLNIGQQLQNQEIEENPDEICSMDELPYEDSSKDCAVISLALHFTKHYPTKRAGTAGKERINTLCELNRILKLGGIGILSFPVNDFEDMDAFQAFCSVLEKYFGFEIVQESTGLGQSTDNNEEPFQVWMLTLRKTGKTQEKEMTKEAWAALSFSKFKGATSEEMTKRYGRGEPSETQGAYHEEFQIGTESHNFVPSGLEQEMLQSDFEEEKQKYSRLQERLELLIDQYKSIENIPEQLLLSISLSEVSASTQGERDAYFSMILEKYKSVERVPVEELSQKSPVILIRGTSKKGAYLCLGRIDGSGKTPCGYGRRYFYDSDLSS